MTIYQIALLPGDGIGEEIMAEAVKVLDVISSRQTAISFELTSAPFGATAWFSHGSCWPAETEALCDGADAILKGTIGLGHAESRNIPADQSPEKGLLDMRRRYDTYANFRPVLLPGSLADFSPLRREIIGDGIDIMIIRELVGGLYFGPKETGTNEQGLRYARETLEYDENQIRRIVRVAFETAMTRRRKLHSVHKRNVLKSSVLWTDIVEEVARDFSDVEVHHVLVDAAATYLCLRPTEFDVMVMENLFGDILSDQGGGILGSLGLMPSACQGPEKSYYEPSHGSAPDIAGKNIANPYAMIGSVAMMLEMSFGMKREADMLWQAMQQVFADGYSTPDISRADAETRIVSTQEFGDRVASTLSDHFA